MASTVVRIERTKKAMFRYLIDRKSKRKTRMDSRRLSLIILRNEGKSLQEIASMHSMPVDTVLEIINGSEGRLSM